METLCSTGCNKLWYPFSVARLWKSVELTKFKIIGFVVYCNYINSHMAWVEECLMKNWTTRCVSLIDTGMSLGIKPACVCR